MKPGFKRCVSCQVVFSASDACARCLREGHSPSNCPVCLMFITRAKDKERDKAVGQALLLQESLTAASSLKDQLWCSLHLQPVQQRRSEIQLLCQMQDQRDLKIWERRKGLDQWHTLFPELSNFRDSGLPGPVLALSTVRSHFSMDLTI